MTKEEMAKNPVDESYDIQDKYIFGTVKIGEKGQICIPKSAREVFGLKPGSSLLVVGDRKTGIALITDAAITEMLSKATEGYPLPVSQDQVVGKAPKKE